ncbi:hypothetical protein ACJVC5_06510 [Peredibacter sp. HCB2-198]|uniref:hypothetical protein n=1 Tax=Peredibacter sp. HCB2-198 TaxID=3383025 RepID=UPI0038B64074
MKNVLYYFLNHKKINGTLFYCFEYFACAKQNDPNIIFNIYNISPNDLEIVKNIFRERYVVPEGYLDDVKALNSISELYKTTYTKTLILDLHSFQRTYMFIKNDILCYSNDSHSMERSTTKNVTYYGYYDYQNFDHKTPLKLNFSIFRPIYNTGKKIFVSSRRYNYKEIELPIELQHKEVVTKAESTHHANLFEIFDTMYYFHSDFDTNNRLIPECFFYDKKIVLQLNAKFKDSIALRYEDILKNGLRNYTLDHTDKMICDFLE